MDVVAWTDFIKLSIKWIFDKWVLKKLNKENKRVFQTRFEMIFDDHKKEIEQIFIDMLNEMKKDLLKGEWWKEVNFCLDQIDKNLSWDILGNLDGSIDKVENNLGLQKLWNTFFVDDEMKQLLMDLKLNLDKYKKVIEVEVNNYFISWNKSDLKLLKKEKEQVIKIVKYYIPKFENLIFTKLVVIAKLSLVHQIKPWVEMDNEKNTKMIQNIEKFSNDIKEWKMKEYYKRIFDVVDKMMNDMIWMLEK